VLVGVSVDDAEKVADGDMLYVGVTDPVSEGVTLQVGEPDTERVAVDVEVDVRVTDTVGVSLAVGLTDTEYVAELLGETEGVDDEESVALDVRVDVLDAVMEGVVVDVWLLELVLDGLDDGLADGDETAYRRLSSQPKNSTPLERAGEVLTPGSGNDHKTAPEVPLTAKKPSPLLPT
jgi:hypothetical protein